MNSGRIQLSLAAANVAPTVKDKVGPSRLRAGKLDPDVGAKAIHDHQAHVWGPSTRDSPALMPRSFIYVSPISAPLRALDSPHRTRSLRESYGLAIMSKKNNSGGEKKNSATGHSDQGKKDDGAITVVYKVGMYCEGCVDKVVRSVKEFPGVQEVKPELESSKLTVVGKMDPWKLRDRVEAKTKKKVDLVSPVKKPDAAADQKPVNEKAKELKATTVVFKISLYCHCRGCIRGIVDTIRRIEGVHDVSIDAQNELVTVTGTMDAKAVTKISSHNMVREVKAVQPKDYDGGGKKKEGGEGGSDGENKEHAATAAAAAAAAAAMQAVAEAGRMDYYEWHYRRMHHAPQLFSDENPNACSIS